MTFSETRLDLGFDYGTTATITCRTSIVVLGDGSEQRNLGWEQPLLRFGVGQQSTKNERLEGFIDFHNARQGAHQGFRFKDWSDFEAKGQVLGIGNGVVSQFQLFKSYWLGSMRVKRPISKPVNNSVVIYLDGVRINSGWAVNLTNGVIDFSVSPDLGVIISADFEFDVPVRFEADKIDLRFEAWSGQDKVFNWENLSLVEVRIPFEIALPVDSFPLQLSETIDLGFDYGTLGGNQYSTLIKSMASGYEKRSSNWTIPKGSWEIGQRTLDKKELDYFIALFRVSRGRLIPFEYFDRSIDALRRVRFGEDAISFRFDAFEPETGRRIFYLSGLPLTAITALEEPQLLATVTSTFNQSFGNPPNGIYPFTITAPTEMANYSDGQVKVYLMTASYDNGFLLGNFRLDGVATWSGDRFIVRGKTFEALVFQLADGPCYFSGSLRWEAWSF